MSVVGCACLNTPTCSLLAREVSLVELKQSQRFDSDPVSPIIEEKLDIGAVQCLFAGPDREIVT